MSAKILEGNVLETLKDLPACSVQCVVTSPPYYGLRDYGVEGQIGLEPTPEAYVEVLVILFREIRRVLKDDGTVWLNLGDSYWGGKGSNANLDKGIESRIAEGRTIQRPQTRIQNMKVIPTNGKHETIKPKDLVGIPWMVAFALRNDGWYLRSEIIWAKKNCMPESVKDRPTRSHEQIFLLSKSSDYYYDYEAIMTPTKGNEHDKRTRVSRKRFPTDTVNGIRNTGYYPMANARDVWHISVKPYHEAHFATFPPDLIEPCILAGSREGDVVLDPFNGSGTTGEVSLKHHREYIGCELNPKYVELTHRRLSKVQPVLMASTRLTPREPDKRDSSPSQALSQLEFLSDLEGLS